MKVKRMGITEILRRIWLFSANKIKSSESFSKQPTQLILLKIYVIPILLTFMYLVALNLLVNNQLNSSLRQIIDSQDSSEKGKHTP